MAENKHSLEVAEQFEDLAKQDHAARLGMWIFLGSETLLFGGLFGLYSAYRAMYPVDFLVASHHNNVLIGTANTAILIVSSFCIAWSIHTIRHDRRPATVLAMVATLVLGASFLALKSIEYGHHFRDGIYPGGYYRFDELPGHGAKLFFTLYYFMTGLHALHVIAGLTVITWLAVRTWRGRYGAERHTALENGALYWHLVDVIWIFLWPLLYLTG